MSDNLTSTDIAKLIHAIVETWRTVIESKGVTLTYFIDEEINSDYLIDTKGFHTCLNTLVSNAAHYTDNGRVHVHVTAEEKPQNQLENLSIIIADTGRGISGEQQISFLSEHSKTRLSVALKTAIELGGEITFNSALGRGSEFSFMYPCQKSIILEIETQQPLDSIQNNQSDNFIDIDIGFEDIPIHAPTTFPLSQNKISTSEEFDPDNLQGLRVLIVDDVSSNQEVIKVFLTPEGCDCLCASAGEEALETLKTQMADVILMDIRMPGMNGIDTIRAIRSSDLAAKNAPIIALTADNSAENNAACMAVGADLFLTKPVLSRDLLEAIRFVRRYQSQEEEEEEEETPQSQVA